MHYENGHTYKRAVNDGDHDVDNGDACHVADWMMYRVAQKVCH